MSTSAIALPTYVPGHSPHFAQRLYRIQGDHLAFALALAGDLDLVREVVARAPRSRSGRFALALGHGAQTPVIIALRSGMFVTCLTAEMSHRRHSFVSRKRIEAIAARRARARTPLASIHATATAIDATLSRSLCAIDFAAARMPREHFEEIASWAPLLRTELRAAYEEASRNVREQLPGVAKIGAKLTIRDVYALEAFWDAFFTASNLHVLVGDHEIESGLAPIFASSIVQTGARALWAAARAPGSLFDQVDGLALSSLPAHLVRDVSLTAAALTSEQSEKATQAFHARRPGRRTPIEREWSGVRGVLSDVLADPELALDTFTEDAQQIVADAIGGDPMAIPPHVARALVVGVGSDWLDEPQWQSVLASAVPWLVGASAAELFVPRDWCAPIPFTPSRALAIVRSMTRMHRIHEKAANHAPVSIARAAA